MIREIQLLNLGTTHRVGSDAWWQAIQTMGTPIIQKPLDGQCLVVFLWQDPEGNEQSSTIDNVLLDVNSLTDHHSWEPECLSRVAGTDVWVGQLTVNAKWCGSYSFIPISAHQRPEVVREKDASREAQRDWWIDVAQSQIHDVLNLFPVQRTGWGMASPLHLPNASKEIGWDEWDQKQLDPIEKTQITSVDWSSRMLGNQRTCELFSTTSSETAPLVVLLDGQKWGEESGTLSVLQYLTKTKRIAPAHYLLVPSINNQIRWKELSCYLPFWQALIDELFPQIEKQLSNSKFRMTECLVAGQSLGGLSSLYAGIHFPNTFSKVISLSGSFWWPEQNRMHEQKSMSDSESQSLSPPRNSLAEQIREEVVKVSHLQMFQTVGLGEQDMCLYNDQTHQAFQEKGGKVHYEKVYGGHDWLSWRSNLINGLVHLLPTNG